MVAGDVGAVALSTNGYGASFASAGVSNGIAVSVSGLTLTGSSATNYSLTQPVMLAASITSQAVSVSSGLSANNKVYDGSDGGDDQLEQRGVERGGGRGRGGGGLSTNGYGASFASAGVSNGLR